MSQYIEKYKKNIVIDMRKRGFSYSEIQNSIHIPKSTIAYWLQGIKLTSSQTERLKNKRLETIRANSEKRKLKTQELIKKIKESSAKDINKISKRELWLMGIVLYWRGRLLFNNKKDFRKGIKFMSSDPYLVKLFLKWLQEIGNITKEEIIFDIFLKRNKKEDIDGAINYWSEVSDFPKNNFIHVYFQKIKTRAKAKKALFLGSKLGLLRIRVRASSGLVRQIAGWIKGIQVKLLL